MIRIPGSRGRPMRPVRGEAQAKGVQAVQLRELLDKLEAEPGLLRRDSPMTADVSISGLAHHSNWVREGDLFICIPGQITDGHFWAEDAIGAGARALMVERPLQLSCPVPQVIVRDARRAAAVAADELYAHPSRELLLVGVTGTSGKTTTTFLIRHLLQYSGVDTGLMGTIGSIIGGEHRGAELTTPEAIELQKCLRHMVDAGDRAAVMEVSSHSLQLHRVDRCAFNVGVFTNIAPEHLDFHGNMEEYVRAKKKLFGLLTSEGMPPEASPVAVVNADDPRADEMVEGCGARVVSFGLQAGAVTASRLDMKPDGTTFTLHLSGGTRRVDLALPGRYNVYNALAAAAVGEFLGLEEDVIAGALSSAEAVPGRFEVVSEPDDGITVVVDFAHTPDELENLLEAARMLSGGRTVALFGAGGDRDRKKRPVMGSIVAGLADRVVLTSDNPRSEDPAAIAEDVLQGIDDTENCEVELDRKRAIHRAIDMAEEGDIVILAGKGHETTQVLADKTIEMDDRETARDALRRRRGVSHGGRDAL